MVDTDGQVLKGRILQVPEDAEIRHALKHPHGNVCGEVDELDNWLLKCGYCEAARYCSKKCQGSD
jgi:hypothetical protein